MKHGKNITGAFYGFLPSVFLSLWLEGCVLHMKSRIDYVVPTWNSARTLTETLRSIKMYGEPDRIFVIDRYSTDDTVEISRRFDCVLVRTSGSLGFARFLGAEKAHSSLVAYVDSDVELTREWGKILKAATDERLKNAGAIGAIYENSYWSPRDRFGPFGCSIVRRQLILDFQELKKYSSGEDLAFADYIRRKRLRWYVFPIEMKHHHESSEIPAVLRARWLGAGGRVAGRNFLTILGALLIGFLGMKRYLRLSYRRNISFRFHYLIGYVLFKKYYEIDHSALESV
jgi:glycosyltransferase involved in cell wall biosynthesis